jgi:hypothetical protein
MGAWAPSRSRSAPLVLIALPLLGLARLLPAHGVGLWLRLVAASFVLLIPGALVARVLRVRGTSATVGWALAALGVGLAAVFLVHTGIWLAVVVLGLVAVAALVPSLRAGAVEPRPRGTALVWLAGLAFGIALWHVAGAPQGDALFHLARVRKLVDFGGLHVRSVDEFADGGLHPGYAFPLWHAFLALVAKLAGVDPARVMEHAPSALAPVAFAVAFESGVAVFRSVWLGLGVVAASVAAAALAPGHGGSYALLAQPGTLDRYVLAPAAVAIFFRFVRDPSWRLAATLGALGLEVFLVHASTAVFLALPLVGFVAARLLLARTDLRTAPAALASLLLPAGVALAWLAPIVGETASHNPTTAELRRSLVKYGGELDVASLHRYALRPEVVSRGGAVVVAGLVAVPLAAFAARRRWAALVLGGTLVVLGIALIDRVFPHFADAVSVSQARRGTSFLPIAFALVGGAAVLARFVRLAVLPLGLAAGIALQLAFPGDFGELEHGGPASVTYVAAFGALAALAVGLLLRRRYETSGWAAGLAVVLFALPVVVHGFGRWSPAATSDSHALTPGLVDALRADVPKRAVVFSDLETSYRISAYAPVYVAAAPPAHVADTKANRPYSRRLSVIRYFSTGDVAIPERYHADWIVVDKSRFDVRPRWRLVYGDERFALYHRPRP